MSAIRDRPTSSKYAFSFLGHPNVLSIRSENFKLRNFFSPYFFAQARIIVSAGLEPAHTYKYISLFFKSDSSVSSNGEKRSNSSRHSIGHNVRSIPKRLETVLVLGLQKPSYRQQILEEHPRTLSAPTECQDGTLALDYL